MAEEAPKLKTRGAPPQSPGKCLPFRIKREGWSRYSVVGRGIEVWVRHVAIHVHESTERNEAGPGTPAGMPILGSFPLVATYGAESERGEPRYEPPTEDEVERKGVEVKFEVIEEPWNVYLIPGSPDRILSARTVVSRMRLVRGVFDPNGEPCLSVDHGVVVSRFRKAQVEDLGT